MKKIKTSRISPYLFYIFIFVTILSCTPLLMNVMGYFLLWIIVLPTIMSKIGTNAYCNNYTIIRSTLFYVIVIILYRLIGISSANPGYYLGLLLFYMIVLLLPIVPVKCNEKRVRMLWWIIMIIMLFNVADNIRLSYLYPQINTSRFYLDSAFLSSINAGGGSFYTFSLFFFCVCYFMWLNSKQKKVKWFSFVAVVITAVYIFLFCFKVSVILYLIVSFALIYYAKRTKSILTFAVVAMVSGVIILLLVGFFSDILIDYIVAISPNPRVTARLVTLIDENAYEAQDNTVTGRINLYMLSIKTWLSSVLSFFFGIGDHFTVLNAASTGIGQHADLLDLLARYGLLGASLVFIMLKSCFKYILSLFDRIYRLQISTIFIIYIICGFTKGIFETGIGCVLFILLPLSAIVVNDK